MHLAFYFRSCLNRSVTGGVNEAAELIDAVNRIVENLGEPRRDCITILTDSSSLEICFRLQWEDHRSDTEAAEPIAELAMLLANLCQPLGLAWSVGHEHDGHLGKIESLPNVAGLMEEVYTAIGIARALNELIIDDEFIDSDVSIAAASCDFGCESDWSSALGGEESFQRFPEWS